MLVSMRVEVEVEGGGRTTKQFSTSRSWLREWEVLFVAIGKEEEVALRSDSRIEEEEGDE
jgi:hypothetical protein